MTVTDDRTHDPVHRVSMAFERESDERLWVHTWLEPGGHLPEHFHPSLDEDWEVVEGTARVKLDGAWHELTAADGSLLVGRGVRHELRNESGAPARLRTLVTPAGRLEEFLRERVGRAGGALRRAQPADRAARCGVDQRVRAALPRRDRRVLPASGPAARAAPGRGARDPPLPAVAPTVVVSGGRPLVKPGTMSLKAAITIIRPREEVERLWSASSHEVDGTTTFKDAPGDRGTEIHVELGKGGGILDKVTGAMPLAKVKDQLRHFKQEVETGEVPRSDGTPEGESAGRKFKQRPAQPLEEAGAR
jgi:quercetin dioxygenase-like cupin family protein